MLDGEALVLKSNFALSELVLKSFNLLFLHLSKATSLLFMCNDRQALCDLTLKVLHLNIENVMGMNLAMVVLCCWVT